MPAAQAESKSASTAASAKPARAAGLAYALLALRFAHALPWAASLVAALALLAILVLDRREHDEIARLAAQAEIERVVQALDARVEVHTAALRSAAAAVARLDKVSTNDWSRLARELADDERLAGVTAIGYVAIRDGTARVEAIATLSASDAAHADTVRALENEALVRRLRSERIGPPRFVALAGLAAGKPGASDTAQVIVPVLRGGSGDDTELAGFVFSHFAIGQLVEQLLRNLPRQGRLSVFAGDPQAAGTTVYADAGYTAAGALLERKLRLADDALTVRMVPADAAAGQPRHRLWFGALLFIALLAALGGPALRELLARRAQLDRKSDAEENERTRERAERLERVFSVAPDALIAIDAEGRIIDFNPAAEHLFRMRQAAAVGKPIDELMPDCGYERIRTAVSGGATPFDSSSRRARLQGLAVRRGGQFPVEVNVGQFADCDQYVCAVRDITEQRRTEEEMRLYKRAIGSSSNAVIISDVTLPDQPIIYVNPAFERMTGYDLADAFGRNSRFLQGPDSDPSAVAKMRAAVARGADCNVILKNYTKDRTPFWNQITLAPVRDRNGKVTHYVGIETDVTERMQTEAALEERRRQLDAIFNLSPDGFVAFATDRRITYVNPAFLRITRLELEDVQGATIDQLDAMLAEIKDPKHPWKPLGQALDEASDASGSIATAGNATPELMYLRNPATKIVQRSLRRSAAGATEFVLYLRDVTRELEVDRMKSEFLSSAAHELRTPMASIFGFAELLLRKSYPDERKREMIDTIHRQAKHLTNLVNELLDLARIEARAGKDFKLEELPLAPMINDAVAALLMPNDTRKVELDLPQSLPLVRVDPGKLRQALTNILSNAYKYSPNGGRIRLSIEERKGPDRDFIGVQVSDQGIGMTPEQLTHACERFYRADTSGNIPGTGLGLSLVKEIMQVQGGSIDMASEYGKGTTVTLWMPISSREVRAKAA